MSESLKKTTGGGAALEVSPASFQEAQALRKAVLSEIEKVRLNFGQGVSLADFLSKDLGSEAVETLKNIISRLMASEVIEAALWPCMARATYNKTKITPDLFEDVKTRGDYFEVAGEVMVFNLRPFFVNLASLLSTVRGLVGEVRK